MSKAMPSWARPFLEDSPGITHLDNKIEVALVVVRAGGSVAPRDGLAVNFGSDGDMLPNGDTNRVVRAGQPKAVPEVVGYV